ncbi:unnamed protein product, partial [marine sediment metagenome]
CHVMTKTKTMYLSIEASGCLTTCEHCWAQGGRQYSMPLADIVSVLEQGRAFCDEEGITFAPCPMHDVLTHPDAAQVLERVGQVSDDDNAGMEPIPNTGAALATRDDWQDVLAAAKAVGTRTLWFSFHGVGEVHDRAVGRKGAFREACLAGQRAQSMGFRCGCNVFLTKRNLRQFEELVATLAGVGIEETFYAVAGYCPTERGRQYETVRPELVDLLPLRARIQELSPPFRRKMWAHIEACTEASHFEKASNGNGEAEAEFRPTPPPDNISLVCRTNFDLHSGSANTYGPLHGNLKRGSARDIF